MRLLLQRGTSIGRLRVHAPGEDPQLHAERCAHAVRSLDLEPPAMPPQAILCVRALDDPLPGGIDARWRHAQVPPLAWESAMRASLGDRLGRAARPIDGPVPAAADAVIFADSSELLACAARDASCGAISQFWWWRCILPGGAFHTVVDAWRRAPDYVPAALEALAATGAALGFVRRLSPSEAAGLLDAVLRAFALPSLASELASVWGTSGSITTDPAPHAVPAPRSPMYSRPVTTIEAGLPAPPWYGVVPVDWNPAGLGMKRYTFAAMSVVLRRSPWLPRRSAFVQALVTYLRCATTTSAAPATRNAGDATTIPVTGASPARGISSGPDDPAEPVRPLEIPAAHAAPQEPSPVSLPRMRVLNAPVLAARGHVSEEPDAGAAERTISAVPSRMSGSHSRDARSARESAGTHLPSPNRPVDATSASVVPETSIESGFAGAFFLLNVANDLGMYSHGAVVRQDIDLGVWDFIDLVARDCLRDRGEDDPLWALLADLSEPLRHPGFPDGLPDPGEPSVERRRAGDLSVSEREELLGRVRTYLGALLGVEDPVSFLIERPGRITRSPGHLDVHFSLERHPIEIRLGRLDRNPGWIPAAGVHVGFHFD